MKKVIQYCLLLTVVLYCHLQAEVEKKDGDSEKIELKEEIKETKHSVVINGQTVDYTATAGNIILHNEDQKKKASLFFIAYTKDDESKDRPVTFCFNGGPGSSSVWLHLGAFGPRKVAMNKEGMPVYPTRLEDNPYSILDITDLVFIDPVSTGYSRPAPGEDAKQFHGVEEDIESVGEFIRLYTTRYNRWTSPKYLAGESYGTTRAAGLADHLHNKLYMNLDGVLLVSSILNFQTLRDQQSGNDLPYPLFLPSYAATAWYHKKLSPQLQKKSLSQLLKEVEQFASRDYTQALMKGDAIPENEKQQIVQRVSYYTGLSPEFVDRANMRIHMFRFGKELLRDQKRTIGRFDGRYKGIDSDAAGEAFEYDPSADAIFGAFTATFNEYVRSELECEKDECYKILANVWPWNYGNAQNRYLNVAEDLRDVMSRNPRLRVFVASGYYDLATPYYATDYTMNHLGLEPELRQNIEKKYYHGGHMMYVHKPSLIKLNQDISEFIRRNNKS